MFLLLAHAASKARDGAQNACGTPRASVVALAAGILSRLAEALGYGSRRAFLTRHARTVGALWIRAEMSPHRLFRLFDVRPAGSTTQPRRDVLAGGRLASPRRRSRRVGEGDRSARRARGRRARAAGVRHALAARRGGRREHRALVHRARRRAPLPGVFLVERRSRRARLGGPRVQRAVARSRLAEAAASALRGRWRAPGRKAASTSAPGPATIAAEMMLLTQCPHDGDAVRAPSPSGRVDSSCAEAEALAPPYRTPDEVVRAGLALPEAARKGLASGAAAAARARNQPSDAPSAWTGDAAHRASPRFTPSWRVSAPETPQTRVRRARSGAPRLGNDAIARPRLAAVPRRAPPRRR